MADTKPRVFEPTSAGDAANATDLNARAIALEKRFRESQDKVKLDIDQAVDASRKAVERTDDDSKGVVYSHNLATFLRVRFQYYSNPDDLDEADEIMGRWLHRTKDEAEQAEMLVNWGIILLLRYDTKGSPEDLKNSIAYSRQALGLTPNDHPKRVGRQNNLAGMLLRRFQNSSRKEDIDEIIVLATPSSKDFDAADLSNFAVALQTRYEYFGQSKDQDSAIRTLEQASVIADSQDKATVLNNLCDALQSRFERTGSSIDLDHAVDAAYAAVKRTSKRDINLPAYLINHANALYQRAEAKGNDEKGDLARSIRAYRKALQLMSDDDHNRPICLSNLTSALLATCKATKSIKDVSAALSNQQLVLHLLPDTHLYRAEAIDLLGSVYKQKYSVTGSRNDIDTAIGHSNKAIQLTNSGDPKRGTRLNNCGNLYKLRFQDSGNSNDRDEAIKNFIQALEDKSAPPLTRITGASSAAEILLDVDKKRAKPILEKAVDLLPSVGSRMLARKDQQQNISQCVGVTALTVSLCIECGDEPYEALRISEAGRGILANLQIEVRSDVSRLTDAHPELALRLESIRNKLNFEDGRSGEALEIDRPSLYQDLDEVFSEIRKQRGFETYLLAPSKETLRALAAKDPIVLINTSILRCDALLVETDRIRSIKLPLENPDLQRNCSDYLDILVSATRTRTYETARKRFSALMKWLWQMVVSPILEALGFQTPSGKEWPQIWWVGSGLITLLPLHAAGYHDADGLNRSTLDRVVSSYIPTIKSLEYARSLESMRLTPQKSKALFISMPTTPKEKNLPGVLAELQAIKKCVSGWINVSDLQHPTKSAVEREIREAQIVHFSCHGYSSAEDPSESRLLLKDWQSTPLTVADLTRLQIKSPQFAFLSSCHSATNTVLKLLDESITLAAALHLAGYPSVVGSLWHVSDKSGAYVANAVYKRIIASKNQEGVIDFRVSAEGLHNAVRGLRQSTNVVPGISRKLPTDPLMCGPYVYIGA